MSFNVYESIERADLLALRDYVDYMIKSKSYIGLAERLDEEHKRQMEAINAQNSRSSLKRRNERKVIYLLHDAYTGLYKIGKTKCLKSRMGNFKTANAAISLVYHFDGFDSCEIDLHELFAVKRVTGEWFSLDESDIESIKKYTPNAV